jgi:hypothetical protein
MTPLERAARALIDLDPSISGYHQSHICVMIPKVRAVLMEIREPSGYMRDAATKALSDNGLDDVHDDDGVKCWQAMIDEALK